MLCEAGGAHVGNASETFSIYIECLMSNVECRVSNVEYRMSNISGAYARATCSYKKKKDLISLLKVKKDIKYLFHFVVLNFYFRRTV